MILVLAAALLLNLYEATAVRVIDGDTIVVRLNVWLEQEKTARIRVRGIDTPETRGRCHEEIELAKRAKEFTENLIPPGARVQVTRIGYDKYGGRYDGDVMVSGRSLRDLLIAEGLARPYSGGKRQGWC